MLMTLKTLNSITFVTDQSAEALNYRILSNLIRTHFTVAEG
jgi:hypothetical protein